MKKIIIIICSLVVLVLVSILIYNKYNNIKKENNKLVYSINYDNSEKIEIYNNKVKVNDKVYDYSKESIENLKEFIKDNFGNDKELNIESNQLNRYTKEVFEALELGELYVKTTIKDYDYKLIYDISDSLSYNIYFKNNKVNVQKISIKDYEIKSVKEYDIEFSSDNMKVLNDFIKRIGNSNNLIYRTYNLYKDEEDIVNSIIYNDSSYLKDIESKPRLLYTFKFSGLDCLTPELRLYSDNTYEYYYTFTSGKKRTPKVGNYEYDITKIIDTEEDNYYSALDSMGNSLEVNSKYLVELLNSIDVRLDVCLVQE